MGANSFVYQIYCILGKDALSRFGGFLVMFLAAMYGNWFEEGGFVGRLCYLCRCFPFAGVIMPVRSGGF